MTGSEVDLDRPVAENDFVCLWTPRWLWLVRPNRQAVFIFLPARHNNGFRIA